MPQQKQKQAKASSKAIARETARDHRSVISKYSIVDICALLICAWVVWRILRKPRQATYLKEINQNGYIVVEGQLEHRLIAEQVLERKLLPGEVVHHINGIKTDNRVANLCVMNEHAHNAFHDWFSWKIQNEKTYLSKRFQRAVLRDRFGGILLVTYWNDLPPLDPKSDRKRWGSGS